MKKIFTLLFTLLLTCMTSHQVQAQGERYLDEIFDDIIVHTPVVYGVNATVIQFASMGAIPRPLYLQFYTPPSSDQVSDRPLVLFFHTGNFLPHPQNGSASGRVFSDSSSVEVCTRLAKMGYVVGMVDYRLGWNPVATTQDERVNTLINAAYRGVQDAHTAIRYVRKTVAEDGNLWGVDPNKVILWGQGTGGYIALNVGALDEYSKIVSASDGKFLIDDGMGGFRPMVLEDINGDIFGKEWGIFIHPATGVPIDTFCYPNHVQYDSDFQLGVNMGGAIGDSSWIDPGQPPLISFHNPMDPFAPYVEGDVIVPVDPPLQVVEVQGSFIAQYLNNMFGNNDVFLPAADFIDPYTTRANAINSGLQGLFPIIRPATEPFDSAPWEWWDTLNNINSMTGLMTNPSMSADKGRTYIDTIIGYAAPRACLALNLGCDLGSYVDVNELLSPVEVGLRVQPVPAASQITFETNIDFPIEHIYVYSMDGRLVKAHAGINENKFVMPRHSLQTGIYIAQLRMKEGYVSTKITFK